MERYNEYKDSGVQWLGEIPSHWECDKAKRHFQFRKQIVGRNSSQYERLALTLKGVIKRFEGDGVGLNPEKLDTYQIVDKDDLIFKLIDLENVSTSRVGLSPYKGIVSPAYIRISAVDEVNTRFAEYYYINMWMRHIFNDLGTPGVRSNLSSTDLLNLPLLYPSIAEQKAIADYLDTATAKIDEAIAQQQKMIDLLNERKQIIINNAVTKGLNPDAPMKDSGVDWIGEIPDNWIVRRGKFLFDIVNEYSTTGEEELLTVSDRTGITPRSMKNVTMFMAESLVGYKKCKVGDICSNIMWMWHGAVGVTQYDGVISPSYGVYRQKSCNYDNEYLDMMLRLPRLVKLYASLSTGLTESRLRLYPDDFMNICFFIPPIEEQRNIVANLKALCTPIDGVISNASKQISLLQERKQIIINEVVTGKVKVS